VFKYEKEAGKPMNVPDLGKFSEEHCKLIIAKTSQKLLST